MKFLVVLILFACGIEAKIKSFEFTSIKFFPELSGHGVKAHIDTPSRHFDVHLEAYPELFSNDFVIDDGLKDYRTLDDVASYSGKVAGKFGSVAIGSMANNRFEGTLFLNGTREAVYIEDGTHMPEIDCLKDPFYSRDHPQYCTIAYFGSDEDSKSHKHDHGSGKAKRSADGEDFEDGEHSLGICGWNNPKIAHSLQDWMPPPSEINKPKVRERRAPDARPKVCSLYIQIDTTLWSLYMDDFKNNEQMTRTALTRLVADLVSGLSFIYGSQEFYTDDSTVDKMTGFSFQVDRIRIYKKEEVCASGDATIKELCNDYIDSDALLKINSKMNHDNSCLAYIFSHRLFSDGVMGLGWVGYPDGYFGVCQRQTKLSRGTSASYNTGVITSNNQGSRVSTRNLLLTLAHEIGHNFGSPHDSGDDCVPKSSDYYIMYPYVNRGDKPNNDKFSRCSRNEIALNLDAILRGRKTNCFRGVLAPICGNQVIEGNEQCDCGLNADKCKAFGDTCCTPADAGASGCKLISPAKCSPSQGPCCDSATCDFISQSANQLCAIAGECADQSFCGGKSAACPPASVRPNFTRCASNTRRCVNGECSQSICEEIGYEACQEPMVKGKNIDSSLYCYLSCRAPGANQPCISALKASSDSKIKELLDMINGGQPLSLPPGSPCDEFRGVCDPFNRCRLVNVQGPLARTLAVMVGASKVQSASQLFVQFWWVIAICLIIFVAISFCALKYCSDFLPTSNPRFKGPRHVGKAMQHLAHGTVPFIGLHIRRVRVPTNEPPLPTAN